MTRSNLQNIKVLGMIMVLLLKIQTAYTVSGITPETAVTLKIEKQWKGNHSGYTKSTRLLIYTQEQWQEVWEKINSLRLPKPELPKIDFTKEMVVAVFMRECPSSGYSIEIIKIIETEEEIVVEVKEKEPDSQSLQAMSLTQPYHIIVVKRSSLPVRFQISMFALTI